MKILDYFYYTFYRFATINKRNDIAEHTAYMFFSALIFINILTMYKKLGFNPSSMIFGKIMSFLFCIILMILFYLTYIKRGRYTEIIKRYEFETIPQKIIRNLITWGYVILTIGFLIVE